MSTRVFSLVAVVGSLLLLAPGARATNITCLSEYNWMNNDLGQNPCTVATIAQDACGGNWNIVSFPPPAKAEGYYYPGPNAASRSPCMCSTVLYSLFQACGICQNGTTTSWTGWTSNCSTVPHSIQSFPVPIPEGTEIPGWAYLSVSTGDVFDVNAAEADTAPDSTPIPASTSTFVVTSTATLAITSTAGTSIVTTASTAAVTLPSSGASPTPGVGNSGGTGGSHKSNTGAIAGGVVGGIAALGIVAGLIAFFVMRSRRSHTAPSDAYTGANVGNTFNASHTTSPPPMSMGHQSYTQAGSPFSDVAQPYAQPDMQQRGSLYGTPAQNYAGSITQDHRPYDPSDPSTYPHSSPSPAQTSSNSGGPLFGGQQQPGRYSGMPEV